MFTIIFVVLAIFWVALMKMQQYAGELIISPIMGFMVGTLYDRAVDDRVYHTVQILFGFVALTFVWESDE